MSKKKATMTLKDFHGGSIPPDLSLPSAPGVTVRAMDGNVFDRQKSWGNSVDKFDHRLRPASAGSANNLDSKMPFFDHTSRIGLNFDEDERKPLRGVSGLRQTVGDESIHFQSSHAGLLNLGPQPGTKHDSRPASVPVPRIASGSTGSSYAGKVSELKNARLNHQTSSGNSGYGQPYPVKGGVTGQAFVESNKNAWGVRKETMGMRDPVPSPAEKLASASALDKVSSGLWSSKQYVPKDAEAIGQLDTHGEIEYEGARSTASVYPYKQNTSVTANEIQSRQPTGKSGGTEFRSMWPSESSERPKLKLLPRSKPLEDLGQTAHHNLEHEQISDNLRTLQEPKSPLQSGLSGPTVGDHAPQRPKLNLKPRLQTLEQVEANREDRSGTIFGGVRPREIILKERGVEDDVSHYDSRPHFRINEEARKTEPYGDVIPARHPDKSSTISPEGRTAKFFDPQGHQMDGERTDLQRRNWSNEIRRNDQDAKKQQKQPYNRTPSPESWRKPVEKEKPVSHDNMHSLQHRKGASATELAEAFSKSVSTSDPTVAGGFSSSMGVPNHSAKMPFSRLMDPMPRRDLR